MVLNTRKDFPANNLPEFIDYVKKNSAKLQFGSAGPGTTTHLGCALLNAVIGVQVTHVPYRGGGPGANDLMITCASTWVARLHSSSANR
jgi:tripartite-type tricarboxylate transporter receptor subunit TctC